MRDLKRNQEKIYYSLYIPDSATDKYGNVVGSYSEPQKLLISLSVEKGESVNEVFGKNTDYDREMSTTNKQCPIDEFSRLWIDIETSKPHNYIVVKVANSRNQKRYAIKEVKVNFNHEN